MQCRIWSGSAPFAYAKQNNTNKRKVIKNASLICVIQLIDEESKLIHVFYMVPVLKKEKKSTFEAACLVCASGENACVVQEGSTANTFQYQH